MGDFLGGVGTGISSLASGVGNLLGGATAAVPTNAGNVAFDPATGLSYPTSTPPDPSLAAQAAVSGSYAPPDPSSSSDSGGGTQSDQPAPKGDKQTTPPPPPPPPPVTPQSIAALMRGQPATNPFVPGGGAPPSSPYFTEAQRDTGLQMLAAGQGIPTGATANATQAIADRYGNWEGATTGPEGRPAAEGMRPVMRPPPGQMAGANEAPASASSGFPVPPAEPDDADKTDKTPEKAPSEDAGPPDYRGGGPPPAAQPGLGAGGMPFGNLLRDIFGLMSGNPMALGGLVQDLMGMAGVPGGPMGGMGGPMGGPMGGMIPRGYSPQNAPPWMPGYGPSTGRYQIGQPGQPGGPQGPGQMPGQRPQLPQVGGGNQPTAVKTVPVGPSGQPVAALPSPGDQVRDAIRNQPDPTAPLGSPRNPYSMMASAPAAAGPAAATPLTRNEVSVPDWAQARIGGAPPMRPTQSSVDRSTFQNEQDDQTIAKAAWMVNGEIGLDRPVRDQIVQLETAFNRATTRGTTLNHALLPSLRQGDPGYYDGISATPTYRMSARPTPQQIAAFKQNVWGPVMKGSNLSDVGWGPMTGNASGGVARNQFWRDRTKGYKLGQETYFAEGPFTYPFPQVKQQMAMQ